MRRSAIALVAVVMVAVMGPVGVSVASTSDTFGWGKCPGDVTGAGLERGTLQVPLDYRDPGGPTIEIAISRLASTNPDKRRGVLLTNSGGPGGTGLGFPADLRALGLPAEVRDSYDVIGMDPRGVGHSSPVTCDPPPEYWSNIGQFALDAADVAARAEVVAEVAQKCGASPSASLLPHISTANTARDMDRVRDVACAAEPV